MVLINLIDPETVRLQRAERNRRYRAAYQKEWLQDPMNRESLRAANRIWKAEHPERVRELSRETYRRWCERHSEQARQIWHDYYVANREKIRARQSAYRKRKRAEAKARKKLLESL